VRGLAAFAALSPADCRPPPEGSNMPGPTRGADPRPETIRKSDGDVPLVALFDTNGGHLSSVP